MDVEKCVALVESIESGSITSAAEKLKYTTSGISKMISSLEEDVGFSLLSRSRKGVVPTENCIKIIPELKEMIYWNKKIEQMIMDIHGLKVGNIFVGTAYGKYYSWLSKVILEFSKVNPNIGINLIEGTSTTLSRYIDEKKADFCIISEREGNHDWKFLLKDELLVMLPKNHKYVSKKNFPVDEFSKESFIEIYPGQETDNSRVFKRNNINIEKNIKFSTIDSFAASYMVEAGLGISLVNTLIKNNLKADVIYKPVYPPQIIDIGIAYPKSNIISPAAKYFVEFAMNFIDEISDKA